MGKYSGILLLQQSISPNTNIWNMFLQETADENKSLQTASLHAIIHLCLSAFLTKGMHFFAEIMLKMTAVLQA